MKKAWNWTKNLLIRICKAFIVVIISMAVVVVLITRYPYDIFSQTCAEQYSQSLGMGPLSAYDVDDAVMDYVEAHIHPGMSRMEVMLALPDIEHTDYFPPYWDGGDIYITECLPMHFDYYVEFDHNELIRFGRVHRMGEMSLFWFLR